MWRANQPKIIAISSGGGHWEQLMLLRDGTDVGNVVYVTTVKGLGEKSGVSPVYVIADCNRNEPINYIRCLSGILKILLKEHPDVIVTTGALPGLIALAAGKMFGAKGIWIDSVANCEQLSLSGKIAGKIADLWITQWETLANKRGPYYYGSVI